MSIRPSTARIVLERWPDEGDGDDVKFRLVLRGHLPPDRQGRVDAKQRIRRELHPQLRQLWRQHPTLKAASARGRDETGRVLVDDIANEFSRCGFRFVPLVRCANQLAVSLEFLVLRREEPYRLFDGSGDLDGRVKTLIDGLRLPKQLTEVGGHSPHADEDPFFCLLEDDKLIYDFSVTTDRLLVPPEPDEPERDIVAVIGVHVKEQAGQEIAVLSSGFGLVKP